MSATAATVEILQTENTPLPVWSREVLYFIRKLNVTSIV